MATNSEAVLCRAKISKAAAVAFWISVPCFLLIGFCGAYLPGILGYYRDGELMKALLEGIGTETATFSDVFSAVKDHLVEKIPPFLSGFLIFLAVLLVTAWFGWSCVYTRIHFNDSLLVTDFRVVGRTGRQSFEAPLREIKNVFVGQSVAGRIFGYGYLTVQAEKGSFTAKNVKRVREIQQLIIGKIEE
jgi:hypothetical protein